MRPPSGSLHIRFKILSYYLGGTLFYGRCGYIRLRVCIKHDDWDSVKRWTRPSTSYRGFSICVSILRILRILSIPRLFWSHGLIDLVHSFLVLQCPWLLGLTPRCLKFKILIRRFIGVTVLMSFDVLDRYTISSRQFMWRAWEFHLYDRSFSEDGTVLPLTIVGSWYSICSRRFL